MYHLIEIPGQLQALSEQIVCGTGEKPNVIDQWYVGN